MRQSILSALNQSYRDFIYTIGIKRDDDTITTDFLPLYSDLLYDGRLFVSVGKNNTQCFSHFNNINTIKSVPNYESYDIFIKMDDDDIYKSGYVENIVRFFIKNSDVDIVSSKIKYQLNGSTLYESENGYDNLGGNPEKSTYCMPNTFAFNKKGFDAIKNLSIYDISGHDDMMWRIAWEKNKLKHVSISNENEIIWNIHGENASVSGFLRN